MVNKDELLPSRPGDYSVKEEKKGVPFVIYMDGTPIEVSRKEALSLLVQITNILQILDDTQN